MKQTKLKEMIFDLRLMGRMHKQGLYLHMCQPLMDRKNKKGEPAPEFVKCEPNFNRVRCLRCLVKAAKIVVVHHMDKYEED